MDHGYVRVFCFSIDIYYPMATVAAFGIMVYDSRKSNPSSIEQTSISF